MNIIASNDSPTPLSAEDYRQLIKSSRRKHSHGYDYNIAKAFQLTNPVNRCALERALNQLVQRHQVLHTRFTLCSGRYQSLIDDQCVLRLRAIEAQMLSRQQVLTRIGQDARQPFDGIDLPLLRAHLYQLGPSDCTLLLVIPSIAADAPMIDGLMDELEQLYGAHCTGDQDERLGYREICELMEHPEHGSDGGQQPPATAAATTPEPPQHNLPQLLQAQATRRPEAIAIRQGTTHLSYRTVNRRANQLANYLVLSGVRLETKIGLCMHRGVDQVVALLAILKAGGTCIPVDPGYAAEGLAFILEETGAPLLLTHSSLRQTLPVVGSEPVCIDQLCINDYAPTEPEVRLLPEHLACIHYPPATGEYPCGTMHTHAGLAQCIQALQRQHQLDNSDAVLQTLSPEQPLAIAEMLWPLLAGAGLVVADPHRHSDIDYLIDTILDEAITTLLMECDDLQRFLEHPDATICGSVRRVICPGKTPSQHLRGLFFQRLCAQLHSIYTPVGSTLGVTSRRHQRADQAVGDLLGKPLPGVRCQVVDRHLRAVSSGECGELLIGGVGLARGFFSRQALTSQHFINDPLCQSPDHRLYRTGDRVRLHDDGSLEYLGRISDPD